MIEMKECEAIIQKVLTEDRFTMIANEAQQICNLHNIPTPKSFITMDLNEAIFRVKEIGFPVVLKIISPQILHKSDVGGVILDIRTEEEFRFRYEQLIADVIRLEPTAKITGIQIQRMMPASVEMIVGAIRDRQFGPSIMLGIGGIFTEVYDDVSFRVAPIDRIDALNLIHGLKGSKILQGARGKPPADINSIINILVNISDLMMEHNTISQLDLNPVLAYPDSACAVDCRIILEQNEGGQ
ncbi:MAG: acetate---CoA ligase (ADP-forming) subunit beta [Thermoproteota archaeon]|nr:acetate---CoA ligase (ADP-forming) subunit beta [Thermoproteota archaeon]